MDSSYSYGLLALYAFTAQTERRRKCHLRYRWRFVRLRQDLPGTDILMPREKPVKYHAVEQNMISRIFLRLLNAVPTLHKNGRLIVITAK